MRVYRDSFKYFNNFFQFSGEGVKFFKDVYFGEFERFFVGYFFQFFFGFVEVALVFFVEFDVVIEFTDNVGLVLSLYSFCFLIIDVGFICCDYLISDLKKRVYNY